MEGVSGVPAPVPDSLTANLTAAVLQELTEELNERDALITDVWVGAVLTLMILSCICCVCSCFIYHKFRQWKQAVLASRDLESQNESNLEAALPSYTLVSGLPTYDEALEQLQQMRILRRSSSANKAIEAALAAASAAGNRATVDKLQLKRLSVGEILHFYRERSSSQDKN